MMTLCIIPKRALLGGAVPYDGVCKENNGALSTIGTSGCGPSSMAQVVRYFHNKGQAGFSPYYRGKFGTTINPQTIAQMAQENGYRVCGAGTKYSFFSDAADQAFGLNAQSNINWATAEGYLRRGTPVIASMGPGPFTRSGHFVTLTSITEEGWVNIQDPGPKNIKRATIDVTRNNVKFMVAIMPRSLR